MIGDFSGLCPTITSNPVGKIGKDLVALCIFHRYFVPVIAAQVADCTTKDARRTWVILSVLRSITQRQERKG